MATIIANICIPLQQRRNRSRRRWREGNEQVKQQRQKVGTNRRKRKLTLRPAGKDERKSLCSVLFFSFSWTSGIMHHAHTQQARTTNSKRLQGKEPPNQKEKLVEKSGCSVTLICTR